MTGTGTGSVTVVNHGIITGKKGIVVDSSLATTIIDYGTIAGTGGTAIAFEQGNDLLVLGSGAVIALSNSAITRAGGCQGAP